MNQRLQPVFIVQAVTKPDARQRAAIVLFGYQTGIALCLAISLLCVNGTTLEEQVLDIPR